VLAGFRENCCGGFLMFDFRAGCGYGMMIVETVFGPPFGVKRESGERPERTRRCSPAVFAKD